jgi:hypothetical protein
MIDKDDQFQYWLADMHDALERFRAVVASSGGGSLDMTPASLLALEAMLLERYASVEQSRAATNASFIDGAARYVATVKTPSSGFLSWGDEWAAGADLPSYVSDFKLGEAYWQSRVQGSDEPIRTG